MTLTESDQTFNIDYSQKTRNGDMTVVQTLRISSARGDADKEDVYDRAEPDTSHRISGYCFVTYNHFLHFSKYILRFESLWDTTILL